MLAFRKRSWPCDSMAMIPMTGKTGSLNVGVATGIALYALYVPSSP